MRDSVNAAKQGIAPEGVTRTTGESEATEKIAVANTEAPKEEAPADSPELIAAGENAFKKCKACHQIGDKAKNRSGPVLTGVFGRAAGSVDGFKYSSALVKAAEGGLVWDDAALAEFLKKPRAFMKGTKMAFSGFKSDDDITAVIAYLRSFPE